eukprot:762528-Hanusia_phi.AAC.1
MQKVYFDVPIQVCASYIQKPPTQTVLSKDISNLQDQLPRPAKLRRPKPLSLSRLSSPDRQPGRLFRTTSRSTSSPDSKPSTG